MRLQLEKGPKRSVGKYEILGRLGSGGMAEVFLCRARDEAAVERLVAVKRTLPDLKKDTKFLSMFIDEARISAKLTHDNIAQVVEFGRDQEQYFIAMEYVQGIDLRDVCAHSREQGQPPPWPVTAHVVGKICAGLDYAHSKRDHRGQPLNIIHRDVSPANILVSFEGQIKLIDFGIARAAERLYQTMGSAVKGKVAYMSPEQSIGDPVDHRTDIYGAGIVLYELLTGRNPFRVPGEGDRRCLQRVREAEIPAPTTVVADLPPALESICKHAVQRKPEDRYASAGEMQGELEAFCHKVGYGFRKFSLWVKESFAERIQSNQATLQQAWARAGGPTVVQDPIHDVPTVITKEGGALDELPTEIAADTAAPVPDDYEALASVETVIDRSTAFAGPTSDETVTDEGVEREPQGVAAPEVVTRPQPEPGRPLPVKWIVVGMGLAAVATLVVVLLTRDAEGPEGARPSIAAAPDAGKPSVSSQKKVATKGAAPVETPAVKKADAAKKTAAVSGENGAGVKPAPKKAVTKAGSPKATPARPQVETGPKAQPVRPRPKARKKKRSHASENVDW